MPDPNLADVGKRPGGSAREAATRHDMRPGNRETVTLTPSEVKAVQGVLGAKAQAVVLSRFTRRRIAGLSPRLATTVTWRARTSSSNAATGISMEIGLAFSRGSLRG